MPLLTSHTIQAFKVLEKPLRIVSLVPSQTELLAHLNLDEAVVGITKFCVHPHEWWREKKRIGGTKTVDVPQVLKLQPDLVIANKEENVREQVEEIAAVVPTYVSDVATLEDALQMIGDVGGLTHKVEAAAQIISAIKKEFSQLVPLSLPLKAAYLIWKDPWMTAGGDTFIHQMMHRAGLDNIFTDRFRYPTVDMQTIIDNQPQVLLLSSEPFPFRKKHVDLLQPHLPDTRIVLVDGEMFSWFGSRLLQAPAYFASLQQSLL